MHIEHRDPTLNYPRAIRADKCRIVLAWLCEFRFSTREVLAQLLQSTVKGTYQLFHDLCQQGLIHEFRSNYTNQTRLLTLSKAGLEVLRQAGRDVPKAVVPPYRLSRYNLILHDLAVQRAVVKRLHRFTEVLWARHIQIPDHFEKPDALLCTPKGYWVALDYERGRRDQKGVYRSFFNHTRALIHRHYSGVYYLFDREDDLAFYQALFTKVEWPEYYNNRQNGKIMPTGKTFKPDSVTNLRSCFAFVHEPKAKIPPP